MTNSFHYAFKVKDLASTRDFYINILGCSEGRSTVSTNLLYAQWLKAFLRVAQLGFQHAPHGIGFTLTNRTGAGFSEIG